MERIDADGNITSATAKRGQGFKFSGYDHNIGAAFSNFESARRHREEADVPRPDARPQPEGGPHQDPPPLALDLQVSDRDFLAAASARVPPRRSPAEGPRDRVSGASIASPPHPPPGSSSTRMSRTPRLWGVQSPGPQATWLNVQSSHPPTPGQQLAQDA